MLYAKDMLSIQSFTFALHEADILQDLKSVTYSSHTID